MACGVTSVENLTHFFRGLSLFIVLEAGGTKQTAKIDSKSTHEARAEMTRVPFQGYPFKALMLSVGFLLRCHEHRPNRSTFVLLVIPPYVAVVEMARWIAEVNCP